MENYLSQKGVLLKDFKKYAISISRVIKEHALGMAQKNDRPYIKPGKKFNKEKKAKQIAQKDNITQGLVCVISAMESSPTFKMIPGEKRPKLINASIPQLCLYYYYMDKAFGLMHIRIQTYLPLTVQVYINGHEWLSRKMSLHAIEYEKDENCFTWIENLERAQKFADKFSEIRWERILKAFTRKVNPLPEELFPGEYYYITDQAEYATDVMFKNSGAMECLFDKLLERSSRRFSPRDILRFVGKTFDGRFSGDQISSMKKRYWGARIKHWIKNNWIKMYNKSGSVLRIETVINDPKDFKCFVKGYAMEKKYMVGFPMAKGIKNLYRYVEISKAANGKYLDALSIEDNPAPASESLQKLTETVVRKNKKYTGFNVLCGSTVMNGDYIAFGFQNRDIRKQLFGCLSSKVEETRLSVKTGRLLKKLQMHKLIAKIPRSRRWRVTDEGWSVMGSAVDIYDIGWQNVLYANISINMFF